jgi:Flp pilus assembly protein TadD
MVFCRSDSRKRKSLSCRVSCLFVTCPCGRWLLPALRQSCFQAAPPTPPRYGRPTFRASTRRRPSQLAARYKSNPRDKQTIIYYAAALRAAGQPAQAVSVIEAGMGAIGNDNDLSVNYAKALSAAGRYDQALTVITNAIQPDAPDWNALLVKGAILDQTGQNAQARAVYGQAMLVAPNEPSLEANIGLSFAMTNDLTQAEAHLKKAVSMRGATSKIRQNLALVIGLEGRFDEARTLFAADLTPDQVEANMAYIRALLTQQNRWNTIKTGK